MSLFLRSTLFIGALAAAISASAQTSIAFGNLGGTTGSVPLTAAYPIFYADPTTDFWGAVGFTVGATSYTFDHVTAPFYSLYSDTPTTVEGGIYSNVGGNPGTLLAAFNTLSVAPQSTGAQTYDLTLASGTLQLQTGVSYFIVVHDAAPGPIWVRTGSETTPSSSVGFTFDSYRGSSNGGAVWDSSGYYGISTIQPSFDLYVTSAVPEPSTYAAIFGAMALGAVAIVRQRRRAAAAQN
ncbi:MAG: PEP-CTERM sorting domain-containing protein [Candidatus Didemnitutus sp.]|nr:PEP-CTERM sorting domain-containing protein [Candidatus Didemnitutus sp.]